MTQYKYIDCSKSSGPGECVGVLSSMPKSLVIENCDSIHIFQGTLDVKFDLPADLEQFDSLVINSVTFERKRSEQEGVNYD